MPAAGVIKPEQSTEISVNQVESHTLEDLVEGVPQSWWSEDTRDKEVILEVIVTGSCSTGTRTHKVHVRHCFSPKTVRIDSTKGHSPKKPQGGGGGGGSTHNRSNASNRQASSSSSDTADDHRSHGS